MPVTLHLRLLATSDLHAAVWPFDYWRERPDPSIGLARTAALIARARAEMPNTLLFDNGDWLQGTVLGDYLAGPGQVPGGTAHPVVRAMNLLNYDAAAPGNHEFNYGLPFLLRTLDGARFPVVCANLRRVDGGTPFPPTTLLTRRVEAEDGTQHTLRIGVIGLLPPQVMQWDRAHLSGQVVADDMVEAARRHVPALRAEADVVVALCHSGIAAGAHVPGAENAALALAREVPGIDAIVTGHLHRVFPGPDYAGMPGVDAGRGTLAGVPAVMPGVAGSHLGVIDLVLTGTEGRWSVAGSAAETRPVAARDAVDPAVMDAAAPEHAAAVAWAARPVGMLQRPVDSFFSLVEDDVSVRLVNAGQLWYARDVLGFRGPLLSASAPFRAGGRGPGDFLDLPAGPISLRHVAELYAFANTLVVVEATGALLHEWLERSATLFRQVDASTSSPQALIDPAFPAFNHDVIAGLTYQVDVTEPPRYAMDGTLTHPDTRRITDLRYRGTPVDPAMRFAVVTNSYRADGGGAFPGLGEAATMLHRGQEQNRDALLRWIEAEGAVGSNLPPPGWSFKPGARPLRLAFDTSPLARACLHKRPEITDAGDDPGGFARFVLTVPAP